MADKFLNLTGLSYLWSKITGRLNSKQDTLVSGTNIKTINNTSLLGSGNIDIESDESIFVATYGTTTFQEISNAYNTGKQIVVYWNGKYYSGRTEYVDSGGGEGVFSLVGVEDIRANVGFTLFYNPDTQSESWNYYYQDLAINIDNPTQNDILTVDASGFPQESGVQISDVALKTDVATDNDYGLVKLNSNESITLNSNGQLQVGGRLGQFPNGGVFYPTTIEPSGVGASSFLMSDGAKGLKVSGRNFAILAGANLTCKSAVAGSTQYRLSNTQTNRFACFAGKGGRLALNQTDASTNGTALITDISFANGNPISAYFGVIESDNDIIITVDRTVNPNSATTTLRIYGTSLSNDVIAVGQGVGASNGKAISLGQSTYAGGNQTVAIGNSAMALANNSVALGHTHLVNKQFCFASGQGHDFTNGSNGASAVGIASEISSDTAFAVGNGTFDGNGNIIRSNALEVLKDGRVKASGTPTENDDLTTKAYVDSAIGSGLAITTYGNADFTYQQELDPDTQEVINECVAYSTVAGNTNEPKVVKYGRVVNMCGAFKNINVRPDTGAFVMGKVPSGCEPLYTQNILVQGTSQAKFLLTIETDGTLKCARYSTGASAAAVPNNAWLNINATYVSAS